MFDSGVSAGPLIWDSVKRWFTSLVSAGAAVYFLLNWGEYGIIDNADLVIHEAGHFFFIFFGKFLYTLGGTLMQLIIPGIIFFYFLKMQYKTGAQSGLVWMGQNLINISVYASDARAQVLPLLGGNKVYHDWTYMLGETGILEYDTEVGYFFVFLAVIVFIIAFFMPLIIHD